MSPSLLIVVAIIYLGVAVQYSFVGRWGMAFAFLAYAAANAGFAWDVR
jgi:hypothetical protein